MTQQDLIPIRPGQTDIPRLGGLTKSKQKRLANITKGSMKALCKNCRIQCPIRQDNLHESSEMICKIPESRAKVLAYDMPIFDNGITRDCDAETLEMFRKAIKRDPKTPISPMDEFFLKIQIAEGLAKLKQMTYKANDWRQLAKVIDLLQRYRNAFYPNQQKH